MISKKKVLNGVIPVTTTKAVYLDGTNKTLQEAIDNGELGGSGSNLVFRKVQEGEIFEVTNPVAKVYGNIVVSTTSISLNKSATQTFTVKLDKAPTANQVITIGVNNGNATVNKTTLTFTPQNYNTTQSVTINGVNVGSSVITLSSPNVTSKTINVTVNQVQNNQPSDIGLIFSSDPITIQKGQNKILSIKLDRQPSNPMVVTVSRPDDDIIRLSTSNANEIAGGITLIFTPSNYNVEQQVTIQGNAVGQSTVAIFKHFENGDSLVDVIDVTVTEAQTEPSGQKDIILTDAVNYKYKTDTYFSIAIKLSECPEGEVTINLNGLEDCIMSLSPSTITFNSSNYNVYQKVTVRPKNANGGVIELSGDGIKTKRVTFDRTPLYNYENLTEEERRTIITENEGYIKIPVHQLTISEAASFSTGEYMLFNFADFKNTGSVLYGLFSETATTFTELIKESNNFPIISSTSDNATGFHFTNAKNVSFKIKRELLVDSNVYKYIEENYGKIFTIKLNDNVKKITINPDQLTNYRTRNLSDSKLQYCLFDYNSGLDTNYAKGIGSLNMRFNNGYCWSTPYENVKVTKSSFEMLLYDRINSDSLTGQDYIDFLKSNPLTIWCI